MEASQADSTGPEVLEVSSCRHQWLIDTPDGPSSKGVCRICGENKQFQNYIEGSTWGYDISLEHLSGGSGFLTRKHIGGETSTHEDDFDN